MASNDLLDYMTLFLEAEREREKEEERWKQAKERWKRAEEQTQQTTFGELILYGHNIIARSFRVEHQSRGRYQLRLEKIT